MSALYDPGQHCTVCETPECRSVLGRARCPACTVGSCEERTLSVQNGGQGGIECARVLSRFAALLQLDALAAAARELAADLAAQAAHEESAPEKWFLADVDVQHDVCQILGVSWDEVMWLDDVSALDRVTDAWDTASESARAAALVALGVGA